MIKRRPARPIAGGTRNGTRLRRYTYWRTGYGSTLPERLDFYLVQAGEFHCKANYRTCDFEHSDQTQVFYHLDGEATFEYPGGRLAVARGDLLITPPFQPFTYESRRGANYHWLAIGGVWPQALGKPQVKTFSFGYDDELEAAFVEIREMLILRKPGYPLRAIGVFYELIARLEDLSQTTTWPESAYPESIRNAIIFLRENYAAPFNATQTAQAVGLSQSHLRALFEKWLGESPRRFHMRCRIELAKRLLSEQGLAVFEVAAHMGFADVHHFSRVFKQMTGTSPSRYSQQQR
jgi:AraC-like DNA-binding protein